MKKILICLLISLSIAGLLLFLSNNPFYQLLELKLYDLRMNLRQTPHQDSRIVFVEMDEEAIAVLGRWPWPRKVFANLITTLRSVGVKHILFDVTFAQKSQLIVDRSAIGNIFEGADQIDNYIKDVSQSIKSDEIDEKDAISYNVDQINSGFNDFVDIAGQRLNYAIEDNDKILSQALKDNNVFIGYSFEVLTEKKDIQRFKLFKNLKKAMPQWIKDNPKKNFQDLPPSLMLKKDFSASELEGLFIRSKIKLLLEDNIELSLDDAAQTLSRKPETIRPQFNLAKQNLVETMIHSFLSEKTSTKASQEHSQLSKTEDLSAIKFIDLIYKHEIFDKDTQSDFKNAWDHALKEFAAISKFSTAVPEGQSFLMTKKMEAPYIKFTKEVFGGGFLNGIPNSDGVLRFVPLFVQYKDSILPHIGIASIMDLLKPKSISFIPNKYFILHDVSISNNLRKDIKIPIDEYGTMLINWAGRWKDTFTHISAAEIYRLFFLRSFLEENPPGDPSASLETRQMKSKQEELKKLIAGNICIVGLTATGTHDYNPIPYEATYPMVGTHGNVVNSILTEQFIEKLSDQNNIIILIALAALLGLFLPYISSVGGLLLTFAAIAGTFFASLFLFNKGIWMDLTSPVLLELFAYLGITSYKFSTEEKQKREIKKAFSKYVSPDIIEEICQDPSKLELGGIKKTITVLFSDIRSFTTYSEKRTPEQVVTILNEYLDAMTEVIFKYKGTLDKYVGDEIMALFGAPKFDPPELTCKRGVIASIKMLERLKELHKKWESEGLEPLDIGIGLNVGEMVVGNMGSNLRMDYTVIGDAVNLGARVEALTRNYDSYLIITEAVYEHVKDIAECRQLEAIKVKDIPVMIYDVTGLKISGSELDI